MFICSKLPGDFLLKFDEKLHRVTIKTAGQNIWKRIFFNSSTVAYMIILSNMCLVCRLLAHSSVSKSETLLSFIVCFSFTLTAKNEKKNYVVKHWRYNSRCFRRLTSWIPLSSSWREAERKNCFWGGSVWMWTWVDEWVGVTVSIDSSFLYLRLHSHTDPQPHPPTPTHTLNRGFLYGGYRRFLTTWCTRYWPRYFISRWLAVSKAAV